MENIKKVIGRRINEALAVKGKMQKELAKALGVTDNTISYFASGARTPNTEQIIKIAEYLQVSTDYLLGLSATMTNDKEVSAICEYTGLNETAVSELHLRLIQSRELDFELAFDYLPESEEYRRAAINTILTARGVNNLFYYLAEYKTAIRYLVNAIKERRDMLSKLTPEQYRDLIDEEGLDEIKQADRESRLALFDYAECARRIAAFFIKDEEDQIEQLNKMIFEIHENMQRG